MIKPDPNYRANPERAVYVQGEIDQSLIDRLTPEILSLLAKNRNPITVYIDSRGGSTRHQEWLSRFLMASDQDESESCKLITVVTGRASSAAADFLCSGSYTMAYMGSSVFFHGTARYDDVPITAAAASAMTKSLRITNDRYATILADRAIHRFGWRFVSIREQFEEYRTKSNLPEATNLDCFVGIVLDDKITSRDARDLINRALSRNARYRLLVDGVSKRLIKNKKFTAPKREAESESAIIKAIVDFELIRNRDSSWTFADRGLDDLHADFRLVNEYLNIYDSPQLKRLCHMLGSFLLSEADQLELDNIADEDDKRVEKEKKLKPIVRPLWLFFVALCYSLQEGDNDLTALDAYWLGLIDEIIGGPSDLRPIRLIMEYVPEEDEALSQSAGTHS